MIERKRRGGGDMEEDGERRVQGRERERWGAAETHGRAPFQSDGMYILVINRDTESTRQWILVEYANRWARILILIAYRHNPISIRHCTKSKNPCKEQISLFSQITLLQH